MFNLLYFSYLNVTHFQKTKSVKLEDIDNFIIVYKKTFESITIFHNFKKTQHNLSQFYNIHEYIWNAGIEEIKNLGIMSGKTYEEMTTPRQLSLIVNWPFHPIKAIYYDPYNLNPKNPSWGDVLRLFTYTTWGHIYAIVYFFSEVFIHYSYRIIILYYFSSYYYVIAKMSYKIHNFLKKIMSHTNEWIEIVLTKYVNSLYFIVEHFDIYLIVLFNSIKEIGVTMILINSIAKICRDISYFNDTTIKIKILLTYTENVIYIANIYKDMWLETIGNKIMVFMNEIPLDYINVPLEMFGIDEFFLISEKLEEVLEIINCIKTDNLLLEEKIYENLQSKFELKDIPLEDVDYKKCIVIILQVTTAVTIGLAVYCITGENIQINLIENLENFIDE